MESITTHNLSELVFLHFDSDKNQIILHSKAEQEVEIDCIVYDYATNLGWYHVWFGLCQNQYASHELPLEDHGREYFSGYIFKIYYKNEFLFQKEHFVRNPKYNLRFDSRHKDLCFEGWVNLVYNDEYKLDIKRDDIVYDLGSNHGIFTMYCHYLGANQIFAFEPTPDVCEHFKSTFKNCDNIKLFQKAISDTEKITHFFVHPNSVTNSINKFWQDRHHSKIDEMMVECVNLENFVNYNNLTLPTVVKCDIEGEEYNFINSVSDSFLSTINLFLVEFHDNTDNRVLELISRFLNNNFNIELCNSKTTSHVGTLIARKKQNDNH